MSLEHYTSTGLLYGNALRHTHVHDSSLYPVEQGPQSTVHLVGREQLWYSQEPGFNMNGGKWLVVSVLSSPHYTIFGLTCWWSVCCLDKVGMPRRKVINVDGHNVMVLSRSPNPSSQLFVFAGCVFQLESICLSKVGPGHLAAWGPT